MSLERYRKATRERVASLTPEQMEAKYWIVSQDALKYCGIALLQSLACSVSAFYGLSMTRDGRTAKVMLKMGKHQIEDYVSLYESERQAPVRAIIEKVINFCPKDYEARLEKWLDECCYDLLDEA